jgi:hypothetical protein
MKTPIYVSPWFRFLITLAPFYWLGWGVFLIIRSFTENVEHSILDGQFGMTMVLTGVGLIFMKSVFPMPLPIPFIQGWHNWWLIVITHPVDIFIRSRAWITMAIVTVIMWILDLSHISIPGIPVFHTTVVWGWIFSLSLTAITFLLSLRRLVGVDIVVVIEEGEDKE